MFKKNACVVMTGDSVTDCGRERPFGEHGSLGNGYVKYFDAILRSRYSTDKIRLINTGTSGDSSRRLLARFDQEVLSYSPNYVTILVGINDIWRQLDRPYNINEHVYADEYEENLKKMIGCCVDRGIEPILISPFFFETNDEDYMRRSCDAYADIAKRVAYEKGVMFIDLRVALDAYMQNVHPISINADRVHPDHVTHYIIAKTLAKSLGYEL